VKILGWLFYILAFITGLYIVIATFDFWIGVWGVGGAIFSVFLFPVAIIAHPFVKWLELSNPIYLWNYLDIVACIGFFVLGGWFLLRAEQKAESIQRQQENETA